MGLSANLAPLFPMSSPNEGLQLLHSADAVFPERRDLSGTVSCHRSLV